MKSKIVLFLAVMLFVNSQSELFAQESASVIMESAKEKAKTEGKNILVMFHASWCGWCKKMDANMNAESCKDLFDKNFIIEHLTIMESDANKHLENPDAEAMFKKYTGEKRTGIPFWLIFNSDGELLEDSFDSSGNNLGCPASTEEVAEFISVLKNTTDLTANELRVIYNQFIIKK